MEIKKIFDILNQYNVKYLVCGGLAVNIYGIPRMTADIDLLLDFDETNVLNFENATKHLLFQSVIPLSINTFVKKEDRLKAIKEKKSSGKIIGKENILVLANKKAGNYHDSFRRKLLKIFVRKRKADLLYISPENGMFKEVAKEINKYSHIIIAGGDGSFESALNLPSLKKKTLGFFPLGAGNAFYSYFYGGKGFVYLKSKFHFKEKEMDVIEMEWDKGKRETTFMAIGVDAEVIRLLKKRNAHSLKDYFMAAVKGISRARADYDFDVNVDGKKIHWENCANIVLGKVPYYGYGLRSMIHSKPDDGLVYASGVVNRGAPIFNKLCRAWAMIFLTPLRLQYPPLFSLSGKEMIINSEVPFPILAGGDFLGYTHSLKLKVKRKQKVLVI